MVRRLTGAQLATDVVLALAFLLVTGVPLGLLAGQPAHAMGSALVALGMSAALSVRRLSPGIALVAAWATALLQVLAGVPPEVSNMAILGVLYATAAYGGTVVRWAGFVSAFGGAAVIVISQVLPAALRELLVGGGTFGVLADWAASAFFVFGAALTAFLLSWTLGLLVRTRRRDRDSRRAASAAAQEVAAEQERTRIARDMHDVVAHSLAVVVAQADGARYLGRSDPAATDEALATIASTAREALADVRVLLAQLRHREGTGPQPTLVDLDRLFDQLRASGLGVVVDVSGAPLPLGTAQQLAVYRIVQEALTNALRHADTARDAVVAFAWSPHGLALRVVSELRPVTSRTGAVAVPRVAAPVRGHGIPGMRERAILAGGRLDAGEADGRFVVDAWLPAHPEHAAAETA